jgi:nitrogen regulatory protein PII
MQTHKAKRVEITIEAVMESRLTAALRKAEVTGYTVLPVLGGSGRSGEWDRAGQVSRASGMVQVVCIEVVERHIGVVTVQDCDVLRAERF